MSRVMVVDDEPDLRFLLRRIFEGAGHEVVEANDGAAALELASSVAPDVVVTDMMMPVMGGAELITRLRGDPVTAGIPIIAASADIQLADAADIAFPKPYPLAQLLAAADALIAQKAAHR